MGSRFLQGLLRPIQGLLGLGKRLLDLGPTLRLRILFGLGLRGRPGCSLLLRGRGRRTIAAGFDQQPSAEKPVERDLLGLTHQPFTGIVLQLRQDGPNGLCQGLHLGPDPFCDLVHERKKHFQDRLSARHVLRICPLLEGLDGIVPVKIEELADVVTLDGLHVRGKCERHVHRAEPGQQGSTGLAALQPIGPVLGVPIEQVPGDQPQAQGPVGGIPALVVLQVTNTHRPLGVGIVEGQGIARPQSQGGELFPGVKSSGHFGGAPDIVPFGPAGWGPCTPGNAGHSPQGLFGGHRPQLHLDHRLRRRVASPGLQQIVEGALQGVCLAPGQLGELLLELCNRRRGLVPGCLGLIQGLLRVREFGLLGLVFLLQALRFLFQALEFLAQTIDLVLKLRCLALAPLFLRAQGLQLGGQLVPLGRGGFHRSFGLGDRGLEFRFLSLQLLQFLGGRIPGPFGRLECLVSLLGCAFGLLEGRLGRLEFLDLLVADLLQLGQLIGHAADGSNCPSTGQSAPGATGAGVPGPVTNPPRVRPRASDAAGH